MNRVNLYRKVTPSIKNIEGFEQNNPQLVIDDLREYIDPKLVEASLMRRGVNKWLRVRRLLIQLKHRWLERIDFLEEEAQHRKAAGKFNQARTLRGRRAELIDCRQQVRSLCHSPRLFAWTALSTQDIRLPDDFPQRPHKRWFRQKDGLLE